MSTLPKVNLYARVVLGVALGALLVFAFQPYDLWPLAIVVVAGFALLVRGQPARRSALLGLAVGLGFFVPFLPWIGAEVGPIPWLLLAFAQALFFVPLGVVVAVQQRVAGWPIWTAAAWVAMEAVRGRIPYGGFTWGKLAFSQVSGPLMDLAAIGGSVLVSFAVALMGGLLAWAALPRPGMHRLLAVASAAAVLGSGVLVEPPAPDGPSVTVAVVQGNVPRAGLRFNAEKRVILTNHVEATQQLAADIDAGRVPHPDVVIWPENSSDINPFAGKRSSET